ncbi:MAG: GC-type dockerin domain-anchored protein, partial [Planctomycetota bacterium]
VDDLTIAAYGGDPNGIDRAGESYVVFGRDLSGPSCLADTNGDGLVTPADFNAWIIAFNDQRPECDQNGDGLCTPADFNAWIINYNNGCQF